MLHIDTCISFTSTMSLAELCDYVDWIKPGIFSQCVRYNFEGIGKRIKAKSNGTWLCFGYITQLQAGFHFR